MDFDSIKSSAMSNTANAANKGLSQEAVKNEQLGETKNIIENIREDKNLAKVKEVYATLMADKKDANEDKSVVAYSEKELNKIIATANEKLAPIRKSFEYSINDKTKRINIKIYEADTKELIREIPPEKTQEALVKLWELAGIIVDEKR